MPKNGIEPIFKSYKEFVLPIELFRLNNLIITSRRRGQFFYILVFILFFIIFNNIK